MLTGGYKTRQYILVGVSLLILVIVSISIVSGILLREREIDTWKHQLSDLSLVLSEQTIQSMSSAEITLDSIVERVNSLRVRNDNELYSKIHTKAFYDVLKDKVAGLSQIDVATIVAANGDVINFTRSFPAPHINLADRDYFQAYKHNPQIEFFLSAPVKNKGNGKWNFYISRSLKDSSGRFVGLVLVGLSIDHITGFYEVLCKNLGEGASITLYRNDYTVLTRWPNQDFLIGQKNLSGTTHLVVEEMKKTDAVIFTEIPRLSNSNLPTARLGAVRVLNRFPMIVNLTVTEEYFLANWRHMVKTITFVATGSSAALLFAAMLLIRLVRQKEKSSALLRDLTDQVPGVLFQLLRTPEGKVSFQYANKEFNATYGIREDQFPIDGSKIFEYQHPDDRDRIGKSIEESANTLQAWHEDYRLILPDIGVVWRHGDAQPQKLPDGSILWHGYIADITERKRAEIALHNSEDRFRRVMESAPVGMATTDLDGKFILVNAALCNMFGLSEEELHKKRFQDVTHPEDMTITNDLRKQLLEGKIQSYQKDKRYLYKDGSVVWARITSSLDKNELGEPIFISQVENVTERKIYELSLQHESEKNLTLLRNSGDGIHILDKDGDLVEASESFFQMLGYQRNELIGKNLRQWDVEKSEAEIAAIQASFVANRTTQFATQHRRKDGTIIDVEITTRTVTYGGQTVSWNASRDITERKLFLAQLHRSETEYRHLIEKLPFGVLIHSNGKIMLANQVAAKLFGAENSTELFGINPLRLVHPDFQAIAQKRINVAIEKGETSGVIEEKLCRLDGSMFYADVAAISVVFENKPASLAVFIDITERKQNEDELRLAAAVYENSSEGMLITDADTKIVAINPAFTELTGYSIDEVIGKTPKMFQSGRQSKEFYQDMWNQLKNQGQWQGELWNRRKDGTIYAEHLNINAEINLDGSIHRYVALFSDITDKKKKDELIWKQASFDSLTGLPNRRLFHDRLEQETKMSLRSGSSLGLLFIDLDRFKEVNDTLGHAKGDSLLIEATKRIRKCVRDTDTVARLGGDEFTVIVPDYAEAINLDRIVNNILQELSMPFDLGEGDQSHISASIGITLFPEDTNKLEELMQYADQAMYEAKLSGRNSSSYFKSSMQAKAREKMSLTNDLRAALVRNELEVYYQPIIDSKTGEINKAEALLRWNHPIRGMISPAMFIPLAEESGLILEIGEWVFMEAINTIEHWKNETGQLIQVSVNKSPVQFVRADRHLWLERLANSTLPRGCITVEITEGVLISDSAKIRDELLLFQKQGIEVSIDDFGTGFSALSYLNQFDIDYLKIDISFIKGIVESESNRALTEAIIVMAHKLGIKTIAEGVETAVQRDLLIQFDCDYMQGYLYSKPVNASEFMKLLLSK